MQHRRRHEPEHLRHRGHDEAPTYLAPVAIHELHLDPALKTAGELARQVTAAIEESSTLDPAA